MWISCITFTWLLMLRFNGNHGMALKGLESIRVLQNISEETTTNPEVGDVPVTVSSNETESQLSSNVKRCARIETVGSSQIEPTVSLTRRDVVFNMTARRIQQCEMCKTKPLCKERKICAQCAPYCKPLTMEKERHKEPTTVPPKTNPEKELQLIVGSRFGEKRLNTSPRYYSLAAVEPGPVMQLLGRLFNISDSFEKFVLLGQMKATEAAYNVSDVVIVDLALAFGQNNKTKAVIFSPEDPTKVSTEGLNKQLDDAIEKRVEETGSKKLDVDEIHKIINTVLGKNSNIVGNPKDLGNEKSPEKEVEIAKPSIVQDNLNLESRMQNPGQSGKDSLVRKISGDVKSDVPPKKEIVDEFPNMVANQEKQSVVGSSAPSEPNQILLERIPEEENFIHVEDNAKPALASDSQIIESKAKEVVGDRAPSAAENLEKGILKIVDNGLKIPSNTQKLPEKLTPLLQESLKLLNQANSDNIVGSQNANPSNILNENPNNFKTIENRLDTKQDLPRETIPMLQERFKEPSQGNQPKNTDANLKPKVPKLEEVKNPSPAASKSISDEVRKVQPAVISTNNNAEDEVETLQVGKTKVNSEPNLTLEAPVDQSKDPKQTLTNRNRFSKEKDSNYFGALVPVQDLPQGIEDPRVKKLFYVGDNVNLPLKMVQDENGAMQLQVDLETLCNCKYENCTKRHVEDRFREAETTEGGVLPELQVSYNSQENSVNENLMESFVDSLYSNSDSSDVYKRSPNSEGDTKMVFENTIEKLNGDIERFNEANEKLLNKGANGLFRNVENTEKVDQVVTIASRLLSWMKDLKT